MSDNIIRIALDLETMSLEDNAAIVQIGAYVFDGPDTGANYDKCFSIYINPESSEKAGLHVDNSTMAWWDKQDPTVRNKVFGGKESIEDALDLFTHWCENVASGDLTRLRFYCRGPEFDWVVLRNAYYKVQGKFPFSYKSPNSFRTIDDIIKHIDLYQPVPVKEYLKHDALADAIYDGNRAAYLFNHLRIVSAKGFA